MNFQHLLDPVSDVAFQAASFIKLNFGKISEDLIEHKSLNSLVSFVDKEAERIIVNGLQHLVEGASFLTEEETVDQSDSGIRWIIDPLDGTTNFLHGLPFFAVSIALEVNHLVVLGVVVEVNRNDCFTAVRNGGAFLNNKKIKINPITNLEDSVIATGFPYYDFDKLDNYIEVLKYFMTHTRGVRRFGSAALDLCYVACGKFDAFFEYGLNPWDVAAGMLIIEEAGGKLSDFNGTGNHYKGKEIIAASPGIFDAFSKVIQGKLN
jgi:myo-inositol-1(or 4)-monophosphatase